mgnify:CR=1 FL=1
MILFNSDFSKAFDSVNWIMLEKILLAYYVPPILVTAIMSLYKGSSTFVKTSDGISEKINLAAGVIQGDTLAPYLFVLVMDWILRTAIPDSSIGYQISERKSARFDAKYITDIDFADLAEEVMGNVNDGNNGIS